MATRDTPDPYSAPDLTPPRDTSLSARIVTALCDFYDKNLFERLVVYLFLAPLIVLVVFELGMGQWSFLQSQNKQWAFYGLLALDYIVSWRKTLDIRVGANPMSALAVVFFMMVAQGLFIGIMNHNPPFEIINDTIPLLMIGLNILRMQSGEETHKPVNIAFLLRVCIFTALAGVVLGGIGKAAGLPTGPSLGNPQIYLSFVLAALYLYRPLPKWFLPSALVSFGAVISAMNRTTMLFIAVSCGAYVVLKAIRNPIQGLCMGILAVFLAGMIWMMLPEDSPTYRRLTALTEIDLSQRTGSIGERQAEWDAIRLKLAQKGQTTEWLGLGFGGLYDVKFTHQYMLDYGHAHYAWAWFNLRFGKSGYAYFLVLLGALALNGLRSAWRGDVLGLCVGHLCLMGLIYCATHVNSVFLLSGLHFIHLYPDTGRKKTLSPTPATKVLTT